MKTTTPVKHTVCPQITGAKRERILTRLANGDSAVRIAVENGHGQTEVRAIRDADAMRISEIKAELSVQARQIAKKAALRIIERLDADTLPVHLLPQTYGISVDKYLALSSDTPAQAIVNVAILNR